MLFILACLVGLAVGLVATFVHQGVELLSHLRIEIYENATRGATAGYFIYAITVISLAAGACLVTYLGPGAAGAGVPAVLAYLNGAKLPGVMNRRTLFAKIFGTIAAVSSGIASGPEAPIIHIGAVVGAQAFKALRRVREALVDRGHWLFTDQSFDADERDAIGFGAGAGVATAFSAPVGGLFFFVEEACSFFSLTAMWRAFLCCVTGYWVAAIWTAVKKGYSVMSVRSSNPLCNLRAMDFSDLVTFAVVGAVGGLLGAVFNGTVRRLNSLASKWGLATKLFYTTCFVGATCALHIFLPTLFQCVPLDSSVFLDTPTMCFPPQYERQMFRSAKLIPGGVNASVFSTKDACLDFSSTQTIAALRNRSDYLDPAPKNLWGDWNGQPGSEALGHALPIPLPGLYSKPVPIAVSWAVQGGCPAGHFNPMASLLVNPLDRAVKLLFIRGASKILQPHVLATFLGVYFALLAGTSLLFLPTGLFVPQMLVGAAYGRLLGLLQSAWETVSCSSWYFLPALALDEAERLAKFQPACLELCATMSDPGKFAIVGAASFLGGSGRQALFMIVTLLEITDDLSLTTPIAIAVLVSIFVGNLFNEGLYHVIIAVKGLPYLNDHFDLRVERATVKQAMASPVLCVPSSLTLTQLSKFLRESLPHNGFPVVDSLDEKKLLGFILRDRLEKLHAKIVISSGDNLAKPSACAALRKGWRHAEGKEDIIMDVLRSNTVNELGALSPDRKPLLSAPDHHGKSPSAGIMGVAEEGVLDNSFFDDDEMEDEAGERSATKELPDLAIPSLKQTHKGETMDSDGNVISNPKPQLAPSTHTPTTEESLQRSIAKSKMRHVYEDREPIDLAAHMDLSPWTVKAGYSLSRAFKLFRNLALRHIVVTDEKNRVVGILTRKDLMPWSVRDDLTDTSTQAE